MLNSADSNSFFDLVSVYLKVFDHLNWNFYYFEGIQQVLYSDFLKFRILEILNFHPCNWFSEQIMLFTEKIICLLQKGICLV